MKKNVSKYLPLWNFIIVTVIILSFNFIMNIGYDSYYWDCSQYRAYGNELFSDGKYNLMNLSNGFRGYIFPTILGFSEFLDMKLGNGIGLYPVCLKIFVSSIYGFFFAWSMPKLMMLLFQGGVRAKSYIIIINLVLVMLFFWGLFIYPLTDLLAMILCVNAVICMLSAIEKETIGKKISLFFLTGIIIYAAYNVRSIYLFSALMTVVTILVMNIKNHEGIKTLLYLFSFLLGMLLCSVPQIIINYHLEESISMMLPTDNLMLQQLKWGMSYQRYETYVGYLYESPKLIFQDTVGVKILEIAGDIISIKEYILLCFRYPLDFLGIYARHIINMFCPIFPEQYIFDLEKNRSWLLILNYIFLFIFAIWCAPLIKKKIMTGNNVLNSFAISILLLPSIAIMPGALEQRFSIMAYVLIFGCLSYAVNYKLLLSKVKQDWIKYFCLFVMGLFVVLAVWGNTLSCLQYANIIIGY